MTRSEAQRWLALYFLLYTGFVGGYVLIFGESWLLPISKADANDSFQIIHSRVSWPADRYVSVDCWQFWN
jgi:hypothetical protein